MEIKLKSSYNYALNLPLSCHLVGSRLGRKSHLRDGFFISGSGGFNE